MDVSIIIVNYNTKQLLANCLQTIYDKTQHVEFEIIVVDNASIDGSEDYITQRFPYVNGLIVVRILVLVKLITLVLNLPMENISFFEFRYFIAK